MIWIESRYREAIEDGVGPWISGPSVPDGSTDLRIEGPALGRIYELEIRRIDPIRGFVTRWVPLGAHEVTFRLPPAPPVRNPRVVCGRVLTWDPREDEGPGDLRYRILHAPGTHFQVSDMVPAVEGWPAAPPFDLCLIPKGPRTICVVPVDLEGQEGDPAFVVTHRGPFDDSEAVPGREDALEDDDPVLPGTFWNDPGLSLDGCSPTGATISQTVVAGGLGDQPFYIGRKIEPFYRGRGEDDFHVSAYQEATISLRGYYSGSLNGGYDMAADGAVLTLDVGITDGLNWRTEYRRNTSLFYIGDGGDEFYGGTGDSLFRHGLSGEDEFYGDGGDDFYEDGAEGDFYRVHPWRPWPGRLGGIPPTRIDFRICIPASWEQAVVSRFAIRESLPLRADVDVPAIDSGGLIAASAVPGGLLPEGERVERGSKGPTGTTTSVTFATPFSFPPTVTLTLINTGGSEFQVLLAAPPTETGFSFSVYDSTGADVTTGIVNWTAQGRA